MKHFEKALALIQELDDKKVTKKNRDKYLSDVSVRVDKIVDYIRNNVPVKLNENQLAAVISFVYSTTIKSFSKSALLKYLVQGDFYNAGHQFENWVLKGGKVNLKLVDRRAAEFYLFNTKPE